LSNVLGGINGHFGGAQAGRIKVTTTVEGHSRSHRISERFAFHFIGYFDIRPQNGWSPTSHVCRRSSEYFEVDESSLGEVQSRKSEKSEVAKLNPFTK
jgi:hypothetical protein